MEKFAVFDIEAKDWVNFEILGFFDGKKYQEFYSVAGFLDVCLSRRFRSYRFYAHFAGRYDFLFLLQDLLEREGFRTTIIEAGSRIIQLIVKRGKQTWYFQDSWAIMPAKLDDLCKAFDVRYKKQKFDHEKEDHLSKKGREYLKHDVLGLYEVLEKFAEWGQNKGKLKMTTASQAMFIFRNYYLTEDIYRLNDQTEEFIRKSYFGGRCEIFRMYGKNLKYYDVNSMYPFAMMNEFPVGKPKRTRFVDRSKIGFFEIEVNIPSSVKIPYIPYISDDGKLLFPIGKFRSFVSSVEIYQLEKDKIPFKVLDGYVFPEKKAIFREYVNFFYDLKKNSEKGSAENFISKLFLNALYGKTGQRREKEEIVKIDDFETVRREKMVPYFEELGLYKRKTRSESKFILPHLASYVTSCARMELLRWMRKAGEDHIYYCDTDSIITDVKLPTGPELGGLKKEYDIKEAVFLQPKMYALKLKNGKTLLRMKGFNRQKVPFSKFKAVLKGEPLSSINADIQRMIGWKESINKFGRVRPTRICQRKFLSCIYDKRIIKGENTEPIKIN